MAGEILKRDENFVTVLGAITDDIYQEVRMVRVNPDTGRVLVAGSGGSSGVSSLNSLTGALTIVGSGITVTAVGTTITLTASASAQTLADVSANSTTALKSLYTMTSTIPVEFKNSSAASVFYISEANRNIGIGTATPFSGATVLSSLEIGTFNGTNADGNLRVRGYATLGGTSKSSYGAVGSNYYVDSANALRRSYADLVSVLEFTVGGFKFQTGASGAANSSLAVTTLAGIAPSGYMYLGSSLTTSPQLYSMTTNPGAVNLTGSNLSLYSPTTTQSATAGAIAFSGGIFSQTSGTQLFTRILHTFTPSGAGSANYHPFDVQYTIDNTAGVQSGTATGIFLNATETSLNSMTHNLMDLQVGGSSKLLIANNGDLTTQGKIITNSLNARNTTLGTTWNLGTGVNITGLTLQLNAVNTTATSGTTAFLEVGAGSGLTSGAGSANLRPLSVTYTINASGAQSGTATGIYLNATETNLNGMTHNLMDLQVGGVSKFKVSNVGALALNSGTSLTTITTGVNTTTFTNNAGQNLILGNGFTTLGIWSAGGTTQLRPASGGAGNADRAGMKLSIQSGESTGSGAAGDILFQTTPAGGSGTSANALVEALRIIQTTGGTTLLAFNGTTSSFPAIKRSSATLAFRLADDSADAGITALTGVFSSTLSTGANSGTNGALKLYGSTSGDVTITTAAAAGTATRFQLPATNGTNTYLLQTDGSGNTSWVAPSGGSGVTWSAVTVNATLLVNKGILANKGTLLSMALPTTSAVGDVVAIAGMNAGLWTITQAASQQIHFGNQNTTAGVTGSLASTLTYDSVYLVCSVANLEWVVINSVGNITVT